MRTEHIGGRYPLQRLHQETHLRLLRWSARGGVRRRSGSEPRYVGRDELKTRSSGETTSLKSEISVGDLAKLLLRRDGDWEV